jgi:uncharacterized membrane protein (Fun14 family)
MERSSTNQRGFVKTIVLILIGVVMLSYFGINLEEVTKNQLFKKNLAFTWREVTYVWNSFVVAPITHVFNKGTATTTPE